jgi:hypothetical protein
VNLIPLVFFGAITKFHRGESTLAQRIWVMLWYAEGVIIGLLLSGGFIVTNYTVDQREGVYAYYAGKLMLLFALATPAFGAFVVVGEMVQSYGTCIQIG